MNGYQSETKDFVDSLRRDDVAAVALDPAGNIRHVFKLGEFVLESSDDKGVNDRQRAALERNLSGATLNAKPSNLPLTAVRPKVAEFRILSQSSLPVENLVIPVRAKGLAGVFDGAINRAESA